MRKKKTPDAIDLLDADHLAMHALLQSWHELVRGNAAPLQRRALAEEICLELTLHAKLEEELFHPAMREALRDPQLGEDTEELHVRQRAHIASILCTAPADALHETRMALLARSFEQHVRAQRELVFNRALAAQLDLQTLGRAISARRDELRAAPEALRADAMAFAPRLSSAT
ncbi:MAG TPA: hemerythrin domain-containing protein [Ramlibacter sp.]|uniref:hemerythrin domain-containing protein n=1 Tax=Ramlibacter sp. TaxID=1917967 RepID=UPI002D80C0CD|nr:hemerythrin domain-containing protein [Ramlibacter sp.]HET8748091.1 hemerythrin domain-containing protein [Ramlibacter sp.]